MNSSDETRYYTAVNPQMCWIDDLTAITSLATDDTGARSYGTTWASTDYDLWPENAALRGEPYTVAQVTPNGRYRFPPLTRGVRIVGRFGVAASSPWIDVVKSATLLQVARYWARKSSPYGIAGSTALGQAIVLNELDPDVKQLIAPPITRLFN